VRNRKEEQKGEGRRTEKKKKEGKEERTIKGKKDRVFPFSGSSLCLSSLSLSLILPSPQRSSPYRRLGWRR
jgi:hypothetical protein